MIVFNDLRISEDKKKLFVDCNIEDVEAFDGLYISSAILYHYTNAASDGSCINESEALVLYEGEDPDVRSLSKVVTTHDIAEIANFGTGQFDGELFYVSVECAGTIDFDDDTEYADLNNEDPDLLDIGIIVDWKFLYDKGIQYVAYLTAGGDSCSFPKGYENFTILWFALRLAMSTGDYEQITKMWKRFKRINGEAGASVISGCNCN